MAINSRKISGLAELRTLTGDEYILVAYNNKSYKIKTSLFTSDMITDISQTDNQEDGAVNTILIKTSDGSTYSFTVKNGKTGEEGGQGPKGEKGDDGNTIIALYGEDPSDYIIDTLDDTELSDAELSSKGISAKQGVKIYNNLEKLKEEYLTEDEYEEKVNSGKIEEGVKYFIVEE